MPTYQYACTDPACANRFELVQSFTDPNASECPICAGPVRKVFSPVGVVFKGSGFYRNDSRNGSSPSGTSTTSDGSGASTKTGSDSSASPDSGSSASPSKESGSSSTTTTASKAAAAS
jgi:putative FmdB family regulatory protein